MTRPFPREGRPHRSDIKTWFQLFSLPRPLEYLVSVDHFPIWRRHIAWSKDDGDKLRDHMVQRYASNMVFMALLLSSDVAVLFSPSQPSETMRQNLVAGNYNTFDFWAGLFVCISMFLVFGSLLATFTAWAIVSSVSANNAHCVLRSSIGLFATQFPSRVIVMSIYSFFLWGILFMFVLLPMVWAIIIAVAACVLVIFIVSTYSALGRLVMHTSAMSSERIFELPEEESMLPFDLLNTLVVKANEKRILKTDVTVQYRGTRALQTNDMGLKSANHDIEEGNNTLHRKGQAQDISSYNSP